MKEKQLENISQIMRNNNFSDRQIQIYLNLFKKYIVAKDNILQWDKVIPPSDKDLTSLNELPSPNKIITQQLLKKLAVCRLNGGLGTSIGSQGPKSAIEVSGGLTFMDMAIQQIIELNTSYQSSIPLILMNSFYTQKTTQELVAKYQEQTPIINFCQNRFPRIAKDTLLPVDEKSHQQQAYYPPGHGDFYTCFYDSKILEDLLQQGIEYIFISNIDNLGATIDTRILNFMESTQCSFLMEATTKTLLDVKGGTPIKYDNQSNWKLLEIASVPTEYISEFKNIKKFKIFNTNNLWLSLKSLHQKIEQGLELELIVNRKNVEGIEVIQLETAMGAAIEHFENSRIILVPRSRFAPVKKTDDLLIVQSDIFKMDKGSLFINSERPFTTLPFVRLGPEFKKIRDYNNRFKNIPSLRDVNFLVVLGDVTFGENIILSGNVVIIAQHKPIHIANNEYIENKVITNDSDYEI